MTCVLRIWSPPELEGQYLQAFDFEAFGGKGFGEFTHDLTLAKRFPNPAAASAYWQTQSTTTPLRLDGKPNRPLTASTVEIVHLNERGDHDARQPVPRLDKDRERS